MMIKTNDVMIISNLMMDKGLMFGTGILLSAILLFIFVCMFYFSHKKRSYKSNVKIIVGMIVSILLLTVVSCCWIYTFNVVLSYVLAIFVLAFLIWALNDYKKILEQKMYIEYKNQKDSKNELKIEKAKKQYINGGKNENIIIISSNN